MEPTTHTHPGTEKITAGSHSTLWIDSVEPLAFSKPEGDMETDVVIVGGGLAGITIAYCLSRSGKKVIVVEDGFVGSGETGRTTAHLVTALDDRYYELERMFGEEKTRLIAESHKTAIDFIEDVVKSNHIRCHFERTDGYLFLHSSDDIESLDKEYVAAKTAGLDVEQLLSVPGIKNYNGPGLRFANQAKFHPLRYLKALCELIQNNGGIIYTNTHAKNIDHTGIVTDSGLKISAKHVVVATNTPVNNKVVMHLKQYAYRTYVIGAKIKKDSVPHSLWWDTGDFDVNENIPPYHYVRTQKLDDTHDLLIVGGEDHPTGLADIEKIPEEDRYQLLENWAREHFDIEDVQYKWSGQVMEPMDGLAYIGKNPFDKNNVYIVTGDSGNGMTHATIAGLLIDDLIHERENKFKDLYHPSRLMLSAAGSFLKEFIGGFANYFKTKEKDSHPNELNTLKQNEGKTLDLKGKKYGVYCDENDQLHFVGAECTHMKCAVKWNNDEKSWDCPCHGSRFSYEGKVLNGPANEDLPYHNEMKPDSITIKNK
ncbi:MAG: puuB 1 [Bacteroidetes bacterium]|jgi:glycine/D-amino acid oxidase-like deaminating enzyme/nitrite reductase/ring-hydroxylating ferredoxin subunit|nr:puuB 1 [Bacteroidota bacterium]